MASLDPRLLVLAAADNVLVVRRAIEAGAMVRLEDQDATIPERIGVGHKLARWPIGRGEKIIKYGAPIGTATADIPAGCHVHVHNVASDYTPTYALEASAEVPG